MDRLSCLPTVLALLLAATSPGYSQGDLTPPGAPAPSMKTLDQVEARTPLVDSSPGVSVDATSGAITISASGSYYLTGNVSLILGGIVITTSHVTVDLNGFTLTGSSDNSVVNGITAEGTATTYLTNIEVENGHIEGFGKSLEIKYVNNSSFHNLHCSNSANSAVVVGVGGVCSGIAITDCTVSGSGRSGLGYAGIYLVNASDSPVLRNIVTGVTGSSVTYGIRVSGSCNSNRIEGNQINKLATSTAGSNTFGIAVAGLHNLVLKNSSSGAIDNFSISVANTYGPEVSASGALTDTNPWANFSLNENP